MNDIYDILIIGAGPAGMTAAIYAARAELKAAVIDRSGVAGGQVLSTYEVDNYPAIPGIGGSELSDRMYTHCIGLGAEFITAEVLSVKKCGDGLFEVATDEAGTLRSRTVIAAPGASHRQLGCPGEEELAGMGVSYCATCDGAFFKGMPVAVVGGGDVALEDAIYLAGMCSKVYLIHRRGEFRAAKTLVSRAAKLSNIEFVMDSTVEKIAGEDEVQAVVVMNRKEGAVSQLKVNGVFVAVGIVPGTELYRGLADMDEGGYIVAGEDCASSLAGFYAAGDARTKPLRQIITAAADGANAVTSAERYIHSVV